MELRLELTAVKIFLRQVLAFFLNTSEIGNVPLIRVQMFGFLSKKKNQGDRKRLESLQIVEKRSKNRYRGTADTPLLRRVFALATR